MTWFYILAAVAIAVPVGLAIQVRQAITRMDRAEADAARIGVEPAE